MNEFDASKNAENWHRKHCSAETIDEVKEILNQELPLPDRKLKFRPILHNPGKIYLQFCGWSINLMDDGTWHWEDTTGG